MPEGPNGEHCAVIQPLAGQHVWRPHVNQNLDRNHPEPPVMNGGAERLTYEIRVRGELTEALLAALEPLGLEVEELSSAPILVGVFRDQAELHGALQALQDLGVELVEIRQRAGWT